ncbi:L-threonylcarbamoyladenylate synthase [Chitinophaga sp. XS-30]|uniref:L-threonylcarbamoyladenylate synthase n=1 Tax=Chitinophaga sp. XS-30 TaxID=2604421 RepID=UPI0011DD8D96|nr:L-threonylcarbamoyladenylate synthase [Chitinophaga sp. XS-30]QEH43166.1 Sua5/YciO/YrdC/YwlC family protein [Chitinophaga sp. XS-30]
MTDFENDIVQCLSVLRSGGLILYPTDTIWGIGCDATSETAVRRIYELKQRDESKSLVILMADPRDLVKYLSHPPPDITDTIATFDRPTTVIYEGALHLAPNVIHEDGTVAIRLVQDTFCRHLVKRLRKPLVSTSANISGAPPPANFPEISPEIRNGVDYVVEYRQDDLVPRQPSRIVRIQPDGRQQILRN